MGRKRPAGKKCDLMGKPMFVKVYGQKNVLRFGNSIKIYLIGDRRGDEGEDSDGEHADAGKQRSERKVSVARALEKRKNVPSPIVKHSKR